jgi:FixJ family two-component response regulator
MPTIDSNATVFVIDDERVASEQIVSMVRLMGVRVRSFETAEEFLSGDHHHRAGCVISDLRLCGMNGATLLATMRAEGSQMPFILITGYADVEVAVDVMARGAMMIFEKPYRAQSLWDYIVRALQQDREQRAATSRRIILMNRIETLSPTEKDILSMMIADDPNRTIASRLGISLRTVDHRRAEILKKLGMKNLKSLIWHLGGIGWPAEKLKGSEPSLIAQP